MKQVRVESDEKNKHFYAHTSIKGVLDAQREYESVMKWYNFALQLFMEIFKLVLHLEIHLQA
jgi:hypothetical protein